jgi:hypothetical protein
MNSTLVGCTSAHLSVPLSLQHAILELIAVLNEPPSLHMFSEGLVSKAFLQGLGIMMAWLPKPFFKALALCFLHLKKKTLAVFIQCLGRHAFLY